MDNGCMAGRRLIFIVEFECWSRLKTNYTPTPHRQVTGAVNLVSAEIMCRSWHARRDILFPLLTRSAVRRINIIEHSTIEFENTDYYSHASACILHY